MACKGCRGKNEDLRPQKIPLHKEPTGETTQCQCQFPDGHNTIFCEIHKCIKTKPLHNLCKYREDYYQLWENGEGPMQNMEMTPRPQPKKQSEPVKPKQSTGFFKEEGEEDSDSESKGLGDTIAKITKATGIKAVVDAVSEATGKDCACEERRGALNQMFPYKQKKTKGFFK